MVIDLETATATWQRKPGGWRVSPGVSWCAPRFLIKVGRGATLGERSRLADRVEVADGVSIGNDVTVGDRSTLMRGCRLLDGVFLGRDVVIGVNVTIDAVTTRMVANGDQPLRIRTAIDS